MAMTKCEPSAAGPVLPPPRSIRPLSGSFKDPARAPVACRRPGHATLLCAHWTARQSGQSSLPIRLSSLSAGQSPAAFSLPPTSPYTSPPARRLRADGRRPMPRRCKRQVGRRREEGLQPRKHPVHDGCAPRAVRTRPSAWPPHPMPATRVPVCRVWQRPVRTQRLRAQAVRQGVRSRRRVCCGQAGC